jgi:hypothetical protein
MNGLKIKSATIGECIYGTNSGAKITTTDTYLKDAISTGNLEIITQNIVQEITLNCDNKYLVQVDEIDEEGKVIAGKTFSCDYLFLAAGSIGTSKLLTKAKEIKKAITFSNGSYLNLFILNVRLLIRAYGGLLIEKLDEKDRAYHLNNYAKLQSFEKQKYDDLYLKLKKEFRVFEKENVSNPLWQEAPDTLKPSLEEEAKAFPKASLLSDLIISTLNLRKTGKEFPDEQLIKLIECFTSDHSENEYSIVINEDYINPLKVSRGIKIWSMFFDLVKNGSLDRNEATQDLYNYLNYNPNNKITTNTKYPRQVIIKQSDSSYEPIFKANVQTEKALVQRQNKLKGLLKNT